MSLKLADFETIRELGSGSFGSVRLVRKKDDSQVWAVKTVSLSKLLQKEKDNALNEVRLLASINIPNVIAYKASLFDKETSSLCIFMEYADGGDLQGKVVEMREEEDREYGFDEKFVWKVAYEILQGLKLLHTHKIIHRDIKSANIFFVNGIAKLGDLNVSKVAEQGLCETQTGTPYYTSPEIWNGQKYGSKCDIWSLGVLLYEMCCLKMPFTGNDFPTLFRRVTEGKYKDIPEVYSDQLKNLIRMCLIVEDEMRPSAGELLETAILKGMEMSLSSFNSEEGEIKLIDPIKCPKVLRFLAVKLPKPRIEEERKVTFTKTAKKDQQNSFKIKSMRKIRSQKNIQLEEVEASRLVSPKSQLKIGSRKLIAVEEDERGSKKEKVASKKHIRLPPFENNSKVLLPPLGNKQEEKKSLKHIGSSRKIISTSSRNIPLQKQN